MDSDENNQGLYNLVQNVWEYYKHRLLQLSSATDESCNKFIDDDNVFGKSCLFLNSKYFFVNKFIVFFNVRIKC